jgi:L-threonylcarbamoyladenylate synthase
VNEDRFSTAIDALSRGRIVAIATETFIGLLADPARPGALDRLFSMKGRDAGKGIALLVPDRESWRALLGAPPPALAEALATAFWPGPLTLALPARAGLDPRLTVDGTVGVRLPGASPAADLVRAYGAPLTATSANLSGTAPAREPDEVRRAFAESVPEDDWVAFEARAPGGAPSTVVLVTESGYRVARAGAIDEQAVARVAGAVSSGEKIG